MHRTSGITFPVVRVAGPPAERGSQYGALARDQIHRSIAAYERVFQHYAGWDWATVRRHAARFTKTIDDFAPALIAEMRGIAAGAGVDLEEILALNTRSEIMFAAGDTGIPHECTSFALQPHRTTTGTMIVAQNWDWLLHAQETATVLEVTRDDGPSFVTLVEAGLLAKVGMNEAGLGLCTNTLVSDGDEGRIGVPYHVLLRTALDSESARDAAEVIASAERALSANYLLADDTGFAVDLETAPRPDGVRRLSPGNGQITHANHFRATDLTGEDLYAKRKPHTLDRLRNITSGLSSSGVLSVDDMKQVLADHVDHPSSVCQHPNEALHPRERTATIAGIIMDVTDRTMHLAAGRPCVARWETVKGAVSHRQPPLLGTFERNRPE
ncbi:acyl-CoA--6-aminopenicillanic acid acyl-transferase [Acrocarpospora macrocephala]|uniref:Acyl-CoA--6-aminopenicillanic acid acyl-transferase n=1 Tax=Acrocarpospora macrocephala TaxID=150177 RepID=A0A5M3X453_9ACTN|nr:C45 family peptidase [Acrocarpospora macrocephala]GES16535.1 acyl-CoA--6-aminopenicillanic acid acyl-transferase [Acrocarpospora macrocephala]